MKNLKRVVEFLLFPLIYLLEKRHGHVFFSLFALSLMAHTSLYAGVVDDSYTVTAGQSITKNVTINVTAPPNTKPVATPQSVTTDEDTSVNITLAGSDDDGDPLTFHVTQPSHGTLSGTAPNLTYTPNSNYNGTDSFTFKVNDGIEDSDPATVSVTITSVKDGPIANDDTVATGVNLPVDIDVTSNDTDSDGTIDKTTVTITQNPTNGSVSVDGTTGVVTYTPDNNYTGSDSFKYTVKDNDGATSNEATVTITVDENFMPTAPVCIESMSYGSSGDISLCFNADGIYSGGIGCRQLFKLRNLSDTPISDTSLLIDYDSTHSVTNGKCGVDGVDKTDSGCAVNDENATFNPLANFDAWGAHTIYTQGFTDSNIAFLSDDMYLTYTENGVEKTGKIEKCQIETTADDMCIADTDTITHGFGICLDFGDFFSGGGATGGCEKQITLRNQSDSDLSGVSTQLVTDSIMNGSMIDDCGIDGTSGDCTDSNMMNFGFMNMGIFTGKSILYDPVPDFTPGQEHYTFTNSKISASFFNNSTYVATYIKDGVLHTGELQRCEPCISIEFDKDHYDVSEDINVIGTTEKVYPVIKLDHAVSYDVTVHYHTEDGTATVADGDYVKVDDKTVTIPAGETNVSIPISIWNDAPIELDEYFFVQLSDPSPGSRVCLGDINRTKINILAQEDSPVCFENDFDNGILDEKWRVLRSVGDFTPEVVMVNGDGRLRITEDKNSIATTITKDYQFTTSQNLIIVEFDYYAYGGCNGGGGLGTYGADGIVNVLFDSAVGDSPNPGGRGGSMGYAQIIAGSIRQNGFEGGWLGLGIDEYGNFGNCNEGRQGGLSGTSCDYGNGFNPQDHTNTAVIRGDGNELTGYEFLNGVELTQMSPPQPPVAKKTNYGADGYASGKYKMTIDARDPNHLYIRLERDLKDGNGYQVIIPQFDAKDPQYNQGETPEFVRYALSGGTGGGCNFHEISWIKLRGNCAAYGTQSYPTGPFDAWDTFRNINDRNISTKIVSTPFDLTLASINADNTGTEQKPNVDVRYTLRDITQINTATLGFLDTWRTWDVSQDATLHPNFNIDSAHSKVKVAFATCSDYNATGRTWTLYPYDTCSQTCPGNGDDLTYSGSEDPCIRYFMSSDGFALRPDHFVISAAPSSNIKAGETFSLTINALDGSGNPTAGYSEAINISAQASPALDVNETDTNCITGVLNGVGSVGFTDGVAQVDLNYTEVGNVNLIIHENNGTEYAYTDKDDTDYNASLSDSENSNAPNLYREIPSARVNLSFIVDHFDVTSIILHDHHEAADSNFTYLASSHPTHTQAEKEMTANLQLAVTARNDLGGTTSNYNGQCYAKAIDMNITYLINGATASASNPGLLSNILYYWHDDSTPKNEAYGSESLGASVQIEDTSGNTPAFPASIFNTDHNGTANLTIQFNFDRKYNAPLNPFTLHISDIDVSDGDGRDENTSISATHDATYLYARAKATKDFYDDVTSSPTNTPIMVQVYCDKWPASAANCPQVDIVNGQTSEYQWWLSTSHDMSMYDDGNITLTIGSGNGGVSSPVNVDDGNDGIDTAISVTNNGALPSLIDIKFNAGTNSWLIYNKDKDAVPSPFYRVRFINTDGWKGYGERGNVVGGGSYKKKSKRLEW